MPPQTSQVAQRAIAPRHQKSNVILYDGSALNVDYASYVSQHDVVYQAPPIHGKQGMPLGDGDLGAMLWCPGHFQMQVQKSDLWADPPGPNGPASNWQQLSAGAVSIHSDPPFLQEPHRFSQRLSLNSGAVTISSDTDRGSCQITAFASASTGVLVINYKDQTIRMAERHIDVTHWRDAHVFALGETIGVLQALRDRRYALIARADGRGFTAKLHSSRSAGLHMEASRSADFTLYVTVATSPRNGDPIASAKSRIESAMSKGFERLLAEQRQHWSMFWQKSFLRLTPDGDDPLPGYLENLWYLTMYQMACCSRGFDAPLSNGGLWMHANDARSGPAVYESDLLRQMLAALIPTNHLELSVPYVDTWHRMLPELAARTGSDSGLAGARFPFRFNRVGQEFTPGETAIAARAETAAIMPDIVGTRTDITGATGSGLPSAETGVSGFAYRLGDGLDTALLVWEAWRHSPDPFFLQERAYPLLRACTLYALDLYQLDPIAGANRDFRAKLAAALRALLWVSTEYHIDIEERPEWENAWKQLAAGPHATLETLQPLGNLSPYNAPDLLRAWLTDNRQLPCGFLSDALDNPDLARSSTLCAAVSALLLAEQSLPIGWATGRTSPYETTSGFGGAHPEAIHVFSGLPSNWNAAFSLSAPGGFRVNAEAVHGKARYVAVKSLLGGLCRVVNPWGFSERARILEEKILLAESASPILEFMTQPNTSYLIERGDMPLSRTVSVRLSGKRSEIPRQCGDQIIGIEGSTLAAVKQRTDAGVRRLPERPAAESQPIKPRLPAPRLPTTPDTTQ